MIADLILSGLKSYIESEAGNHPVIDDLTIVLRDNDEDKVYPLLVLDDEATAEHPVLRGVQDPLTVGAYVHTVPHADGASASATTQETHRTYTDALFSILGDTDAVTYLNSIGGFQVFDIRGTEATTDEEDGRNVTRFEIRVVCCKT